MEPISQLTEQERTVLALLAIGQRNARIADELSISARTVENRLYHIFDKLSVLPRTEPAIFALNIGLISPLEMSGISHDIWRYSRYTEDTYLEIHMEIENRISLVEEILDARKLEMGNDYTGYKNHVYRMIHFCFALHDCKSEEREKIIIAGCFHDLGIWINNTFDYLPPSIALVKEYLTQNRLDHWFAEIELMIDMHHKLRSYRDDRYPLVEVFRKGDLVDFSLGIVKCGLPKSFIKRVKERFPNAGFHKRLVQLELGWVSKHPLNPLPVLKW